MFNVHPWETKPLLWWIDSYSRIDFSPSYHKNSIDWTLKEKQFFIDTIINGYDVPKFYVIDFHFADSILNEKKLPYAIVDGKQIFIAIKEFYENKIKLSDDFILEEKPSIQISGMTYYQLLQNYPKYVGKFNDYNLTVTRIITDSKKHLDDLFSRLDIMKN
jgi:hypothetical protein